MELARSSKMFVSYHLTTWCHNLNLLLDVLIFKNTLYEESVLIIY